MISYLVLFSSFPEISDFFLKLSKAENITRTIQEYQSFDNQVNKITTQIEKNIVEGMDFCHNINEAVFPKELRGVDYKYAFFMAGCLLKNKHEAFTQIISDSKYPCFLLSFCFSLCYKSFQSPIYILIITSTILIYFSVLLCCFRVFWIGNTVIINALKTNSQNKKKYYFAPSIVKELDFLLSTSTSHNSFQDGVKQIFQKNVFLLRFRCKYTSSIFHFISLCLVGFLLYQLILNMYKKLDML